ncbi:mucin-2 isoform X2 [Toxorhynchites rutilus septentrionalis]|uniref:mucin-2 isoform X2 n=1 Tax=Toxorhynchites rutilus septentrionalis TaxID=329112 RepID=UPI00247A0D16|nr:mucin-2 isoform X2 [Toxorhynchites rutilus septentrionalis]
MMEFSVGVLWLACLVLLFNQENVLAQTRRSFRNGAAQPRALGSNPKSSHSSSVDFNCPEEFGYYPHPTDCTQYYVCVFGGALLESCTGGLMYSHELQTCDWPRNVGCDLPALSAPSAPSRGAVTPRVPQVFSRIRYSSMGASAPSAPSGPSGPSAPSGPSGPEPSAPARVQRIHTLPPPPPPANPNPVITNRGQAKNSPQEDIAKLYAEAHDTLPPVEEDESDRQQRVYRGQPSTVTQVQRDRDGILQQPSVNAIPTHAKVGSFAYSAQPQPFSDEDALQDLDHQSEHTKVHDRKKRDVASQDTKATTNDDPKDPSIDPITNNENTDTVKQSQPVKRSDGEESPDSTKVIDPTDLEESVDSDENLRSIRQLRPLENWQFSSLDNRNNFSPQGYDLFPFPAGSNTDAKSDARHFQQQTYNKKEINSYNDYLEAYAKAKQQGQYLQPVGIPSHHKAASSQNYKPPNKINPQETILPLLVSKQPPRAPQYQTAFTAAAFVNNHKKYSTPVPDIDDDNIPDNFAYFHFGNSYSSTPISVNNNNKYSAQKGPLVPPPPPQPSSQPLKLSPTTHRNPFIAFSSVGGFFNNQPTSSPLKESFISVPKHPGNNLHEVKAQKISIRPNTHTPVFASNSIPTVNGRYQSTTPKAPVYSQEYYPQNTHASSAKVPQKIQPVVNYNSFPVKPTYEDSTQKPSTYFVTKSTHGFQPIIGSTTPRYHQQAAIQPNAEYNQFFASIKNNHVKQVDTKLLDELQDFGKIYPKNTTTNLRPVQPLAPVKSVQNAQSLKPVQPTQSLQPLQQYDPMLYYGPSTVKPTRGYIEYYYDEDAIQNAHGQKYVKNTLNSNRKPTFQSPPTVEEEEEYYDEEDEDDYEYRFPVNKSKYTPMTETMAPRPLPSLTTARPQASVSGHIYYVNPNKHETSTWRPSTITTHSPTTSDIPPIIKFPGDVFEGIKPFGDIPRYQNKTTTRPYVNANRPRVPPRPTVVSNSNLIDETTSKELLRTTARSPITAKGIVKTYTTPTSVTQTPPPPVVTRSTRTTTTTTVAPTSETTSRKRYTVRPNRGQQRWRSSTETPEEPTVSTRPNKNRYNHLELDERLPNRVETSSPAPAPSRYIPEQPQKTVHHSSQSSKNYYNTSSYDPSGYDYYYAVNDDDVELYRDVEYQPQYNQNNQQSPQQPQKAIVSSTYRPTVVTTIAPTSQREPSTYVTSPRTTYQQRPSYQADYDDALVSQLEDDRYNQKQTNTQIRSSQLDEQSKKSTPKPIILTLAARAGPTSTSTESPILVSFSPFSYTPRSPSSGSSIYKPTTRTTSTTSTTGRSLPFDSDGKPLSRIPPEIKFHPIPEDSYYDDDDDYPLSKTRYEYDARDEDSSNDQSNKKFITQKLLPVNPPSSNYTSGGLRGDSPFSYDKPRNYFTYSFNSSPEPLRSLSSTTETTTTKPTTTTSATSTTTTTTTTTSTTTTTPRPEIQKQNVHTYVISDIQPESFKAHKPVIPLTRVPAIPDYDSYLNPSIRSRGQNTFLKALGTTLSATQQSTIATSTTFAPVSAYSTARPFNAQDTIKTIEVDGSQFVEPNFTLVRPSSTQSPRYILNSDDFRVNGSKHRLTLGSIFGHGSSTTTTTTTRTPILSSSTRYEPRPEYSNDSKVPRVPSGSFKYEPQTTERPVTRTPIYDIRTEHILPSSTQSPRTAAKSENSKTNQTNRLPVTSTLSPSAAPTRVTYSYSSPRYEIGLDQVDYRKTVRLSSMYSKPEEHTSSTVRPTTSAPKYEVKPDQFEDHKSIRLTLGTVFGDKPRLGLSTVYTKPEEPISSTERFTTTSAPRHQIKPDQFEDGKSIRLTLGTGFGGKTRYEISPEQVDYRKTIGSSVYTKPEEYISSTERSTTNAPRYEVNPDKVSPDQIDYRKTSNLTSVYTTPKEFVSSTARPTTTSPRNEIKPVQLEDNKSIRTNTRYETNSEPKDYRKPVGLSTVYTKPREFVSSTETPTTNPPRYRIKSNQFEDNEFIRGKPRPEISPDHNDYRKIVGYTKLEEHTSTTTSSPRYEVQPSQFDNNKSIRLTLNAGIGGRPAITKGTVEVVELTTPSPKYSHSRVFDKVTSTTTEPTTTTTGKALHFVSSSTTSPIRSRYYQNRAEATASTRLSSRPAKVSYLDTDPTSPSEWIASYPDNVFSKPQTNTLQEQDEQELDDSYIPFKAETDFLDQLEIKTLPPTRFPPRTTSTPPPSSTFDSRKISEAVQSFTSRGQIFKDTLNKTFAPSTSTRLLVSPFKSLEVQRQMTSSDKSLIYSTPRVISNTYRVTSEAPRESSFRSFFSITAPSKLTTFVKPTTTPATRTTHDIATTFTTSTTTTTTPAPITTTTTSTTTTTTTEPTTTTSSTTPSTTTTTTTESTTSTSTTPLTSSSTLTSSTSAASTEDYTATNAPKSTEVYRGRYRPMFTFIKPVESSDEVTTPRYRHRSRGHLRRTYSRLRPTAAKATLKHGNANANLTSTSTETTVLSISSEYPDRKVTLSVSPSVSSSTGSYANRVRTAESRSRDASDDVSSTNTTHYRSRFSDDNAEVYKKNIAPTENVTISTESEPVDVVKITDKPVYYTRFHLTSTELNTFRPSSNSETESTTKKFRATVEMPEMNIPTEKELLSYQQEDNTSNEEDDEDEDEDDEVPPEEDLADYSYQESTTVAPTTTTTARTATQYKPLYRSSRRYTTTEPTTTTTTSTSPRYTSSSSTQRLPSTTTSTTVAPSTQRSTTTSTTSTTTSTTTTMTTTTTTSATSSTSHSPSTTTTPDEPTHETTSSSTSNTTHTAITTTTTPRLPTTYSMNKLPPRASRVNNAIKTTIAAAQLPRRYSKPSAGKSIQCTENSLSAKCNEIPSRVSSNNNNNRNRGNSQYATDSQSTVASNRGTHPPRARPTLKPSQTIVSKAQEFIDIYRHPATRPEPLYPQPTPDKTAAKCRKDVCLLPDCYCGGKDIPGDMQVEQVPQIVLLTFDDSVNDLNKQLYQDLFERGRVNPNGCPISATFYVSHEWTDYSQVQNLYADGHEMASHTVSHSFGEAFSPKKWAREVAGQREILSAYGGVKLEDVRGMRAPFLSIGGNKMFKMLHDFNFTYDSSMPVYENRPPSWPYTLDYKIFHDCMIPPCPTKSYPGVWEVPMVMWQDLNGGRCSMGDACSNPPDAENVYKMIMKNFERHYTTNRAPFGLYYHAAWFTQPHHKEGFIQFLDAINSMKDVFIVTNWQALQWVRDPTPMSRMNSFQPFQCNYSDRPKRCNNPKVCNLWHKSGVRYMRTCQPCPEIYPWTGKTGIRSSRIDNDIEVADTN